MKQSITELIAALSEKGAVLTEMTRLLEEEQACLASLDLARMDENQQQIGTVMERMALLSHSCQTLIGSVGAELGLPANQTLSPIIEKVGQPERGALKSVQRRIAEQSQALNGALTLNRVILEDSLNVVGGSLNFFNRLFNPVDTYGNAGFMVSNRGGSRLVCKEI
jgi:hypothetical protein